MSKKILFFNSYFPFSPGGTEYQVFLLAEELRHQMEVIFLNTDSCNRPARMEHDGFTICNLPKRRLLRRLLGPCSVLDSLKALRLLQDIRPDVIYQRSGYANTGIAARYCRNSNCRFIWHIASDTDVSPCAMPLRLQVVFEYIDRKVLEYGIRRADRIIGQTNHQCELLRRHFGRPCDLIVPNFHPSPQEADPGPRLSQVAWIANFKRLKRPELFLDLAKELAHVENLRFVMVGASSAGRWQDGLNRRMQSLTNLKYPGRLSQRDVNQLLTQSSVLVNTSTFEGFPNTFIQAWMRGTPVVSLDVNPDGVLDNERIGFHSRTLERMISDVHRLVTDRPLWERMSAKARAYATETHSIERNVPKIIALISELARRP